MRRLAGQSAQDDRVMVHCAEDSSNGVGECFGDGRKVMEVAHVERGSSVHNAADGGAF
jgi:hypothetical protein